MRRLRTIALGISMVLVIGVTGCSDDDDGSETSTDDTTETTAGSDTSTTAGEATTTTAGDTTTTGALGPATEFDLTAIDFGYERDGTAPISAGRVAIRLTNTGAQEHQAAIVSFKEGKTASDLLNMGEDLSQLDDIVNTHGGPNGAAPGATVTAMVDLAPGEYNIMCFIPDPADGQPHVAKGQVLPLVVTENAGAATGLPETTETVLLRDFEFELPEGFTGAGNVTVTNEGAQMHELAAYKAADGATADDVAAVLTYDPASGAPAPTGPPPIAGSTGVTAMDAELSNVLQMDLTPGEWLFICFLPDAETGAPHFTEGMITTVTIE
jgi:hypothetical protein